jgi:hypothetical protein
MLVSGLDLGKVADFSALAVLDRKAAPKPTAKRRYQYALRWLQTWELGTPYSARTPGERSIIGDVRGRFDSPQLRWTHLAVDMTGVGTAVVEQLQAAKVPARLNPVLITSGHQISRPEETKERAWHVPKKELVSTLLVLLEAGLVKWSPSLPLVARLEKELANFRVTLTRAKNETFGAEGSQHDDLVLAVALAAWLGEHAGSGDPRGIGLPEEGKGSVVEAGEKAGAFVEQPGEDRHARF